MWIVQNINFQYFSILITLVSAIVMVGVSYMTAAPDYAKIQNLSFGTRTDQHKLDSASSWDWRDIVTSAVVLVVIIAGLPVLCRITARTWTGHVLPNERPGSDSPTLLGCIEEYRGPCTG